MKKSCLTEPRQRLIEQCQDIGFGRITFPIRGHEPEAHQPWRIRQTVKFASDEGLSRPERALADFELCKEQIAMLAQLARIRDGGQATIEVRHGLPFLIEIEQDYLAA